MREESKIAAFLFSLPLYLRGLLVDCCILSVFFFLGLQQQQRPNLVSINMSEEEKASPSDNPTANTVKLPSTCTAPVIVGKVSRWNRKKEHVAEYSSYTKAGYKDEGV